MPTSGSALSTDANPWSHVTDPVELAVILAVHFPPPEQPASGFPGQVAAEPQAQLEFSVVGGLGTAAPTEAAQEEEENWDWDVIEVLANPLESGDDLAAAPAAADTAADHETAALLASMVKSQKTIREVLAQARQVPTSCPHDSAVVSAMGNAADWIETHRRNQLDTADIHNVRELERMLTAAKEVVLAAQNDTFNPRRKEHIQSAVLRAAQERNVSLPVAAAAYAQHAAKSALNYAGLGPISQVAVAAAGSIALHMLDAAVGHCRSTDEARAASVRMRDALNETEGGRIVWSHLDRVWRPTSTSNVN